MTHDDVLALFACQEDFVRDRKIVLILEPEDKHVGGVKWVGIGYIRIRIGCPLKIGCSDLIGITIQKQIRTGTNLGDGLSRSPDQVFGCVFHDRTCIQNTAMGIYVCNLEEDVVVQHDLFVVVNRLSELIGR